LAGRSSLNDSDEYSGSSLGVFFFYILPVLIWLLGRTLRSREKEKDGAKLDKYDEDRAQFNNYIAGWAKAAEVDLKERYDSEMACKACGKKIPKVARYQQWMGCCHCKSTFQNPDWKPQQNSEWKPAVTTQQSSNNNAQVIDEKFPELTEEEIKEANWMLTGTKYTQCPNCNHKDLITIFLPSSIGNLYRKCNSCGTHFQFSKSILNLQEAIYTKCVKCRKVVKVGSSCPCNI
jgi:transcription elongation factor Elf1